jgi:hypothetical protein
MPPTDENPAAPIFLTPAEARVLGALMEKEATTPEYYPLSLNALVNACNQRSSREPVMALDEVEVRQALHGLEEQHLAGRARSADGRVTKYEHWLGEFFNFSRAESALVCVLLLRGPQTPGELRGRTERLHHFEEMGEVLSGLQKLIERTPPLVAVLARQPGTKESRYAHLLCGALQAADLVELAQGTSRPFAEPAYPRHEAGQSAEQNPALNANQEERIAQLEAAVACLRQEIAALRQKIDDLFGDG